MWSFYRSILVCLSGAAVCGIAFATSPTPPAGPAEGPPPASGAVEAASPESADLGADPSALARKIWWNQPKKIDELGLDVGQRRRMDAALTTFSELRARTIREQRLAFQAFGEALASGDRARIDERGRALKLIMAAPLEGQVTLMAAVVAELRPDQRRRLTELYPKLLQRQWVRSGRGLIGRRGGR
ncbi:MAG: hypothetical protein AAGM22_16870 [Acidobacteriota bacterium]